MSDPSPATAIDRVIVTGGSGGIGGAIVERYLRAGADVVNIDRAGSGPGSSFTVHADISRQDEVERAMAQIGDRWGGKAPDVFVGCAAISRPSHLLKTPVDEFDAMVAVNIRGTFLTTQAAGRLMAKAGRGSIVLISSVAARQAWAQEAVYSATKAATSSLVQGFAVDLAPFGIRVNAVAPGPVEHKAQTMATTRTDPEVFQHEIDRTPFARLGGPEEVAETVFLLAQAPWVTGQTLYADGGFLASGLGYFGQARKALLSGS